MNTATNILFSILILGVSSQICEESGECVDSIFLGSVPANNSVDCLNKCRNNNDCSFGLFRPDSNLNLCLLFQTCTRLETELCPNCLTSSTECAQCDVPGLCLVSIYFLLSPLKMGSNKIVLTLRPLLPFEKNQSSSIRIPDLY